MAIYTPRGLKIRVPTDYAFALIARLRPSTDAFEVLKTTEGLESLHNAFAFIAGLICFVLKLSPYAIGLIVFIVIVQVSMKTREGSQFFLLTFVKIGVIYSYVSGFGILLILLCGLGMYLVGWQGVLAFFAARSLAGIVNAVLNWRDMSYYKVEIGDAITPSERNFINAYRLHASRLGKTIDVSVSDEEMDEKNWKPALVDLALKWPEVAARITSE